MPSVLIFVTACALLLTTQGISCHFAQFAMSTSPSLTRFRKFNDHTTSFCPGSSTRTLHLDLTHVGRIPYPGSFTDWIASIRGMRVNEDDVALRASVEDGIARALRGGTVLIGDIAGMESTVPVHALAESDLDGVSFVEFLRSQRHRSRRH